MPHLSRESSLQSRARHSPMFLATPPGRCCTVPGTEPPLKSISPSQGFACKHSQYFCWLPFRGCVPA